MSYTEPNWYCIDRYGLATLCAGEDDARENAADNDKIYPRQAPYRAVQLVEAAAAPVGAPAGWQLVPVEPTPEMSLVGEDAFCAHSRSGATWTACMAVGYRAMLAAAAPLAPVGAVLPADAIAQAVAAERDRVDRTMLELIDLWGTHGNAALIAGDAATSNQWALAVATLRDVSAALRADRVEAAQAEKREG